MTQNVTFRQFWVNDQQERAIDKREGIGLEYRYRAGMDQNIVKYTAKTGTITQSYCRRTASQSDKRGRTKPQEWEAGLARKRRTSAHKRCADAVETRNCTDRL